MKQLLEIGNLKDHLGNGQLGDDLKFEISLNFMDSKVVLSLLVDRCFCSDNLVHG